MAKSKKPHRAVLSKSLRKWFTRQARRLLCIAEVEPEKDLSRIIHSIIGQHCKMASASGRLLNIFLLTLTVAAVFSWDTDDFEIFDLVEEVNRNFYELLEVDPSATTSDIRRAYRRLSLQLHPDKNKAEDAEVQFRQMVAVYEVLKDEEKRQRYDRVLVEGLPDWRQPVFYYRRVRKMGMLELTGLLGFILTIGQYLVAWAVYFEKRLSLEDFYASKKKLVESKNKKKSKIGVEELEEEIEEELKSLPQPRILDLWMFRLPGFLLYLVRITPELLLALKEYIRSRRKVEEEEEEDDEDYDGEKESTRKVKRKKIEIPEYQADLYQMATSNTFTEKTERTSSDETEHKQRKKDGDWSEEELILLAKAVSKFPGGTVNRWEKIANFVGRTVDEENAYKSPKEDVYSIDLKPLQVTLKSKQVKGGTYSMNLSSNVQGSSFSGKTKKRDWDISDSIISTPDTSENLELTEEDNKPRKRNKPSKIVKTADRTLSITDNPPKTESVSKTKSQVEGATAASQETQDSKTNQSDSSKVKLGDDTWTQNQQMIFEWALKHTPKNVEKRWEKIAEHLPGKTKENAYKSPKEDVYSIDLKPLQEDCIQRFKYLADLVKKKKMEGQKTGEQS